ncbi:MAG: cupin domain-containing protein [Pseudorhodoplanes sp.]
MSEARLAPSPVAPARSNQTFRRVVTGTDAGGRSRVVWDGESEKMHAPSMGSGRRYTDLWIWNESPAPLSGTNDDANLGYNFPGPIEGGHLRVVKADGPPPGYDPNNDKDFVAPHAPKVIPPGRMWDRGYNNAFTSPMHKTETVDYGIVLTGERVLVLDDVELTMRPGDIVVQVGAWHRWAVPGSGATMMFDMISARFEDGEAGLGQGPDETIALPADFKMPAGIRPVRRIVTIDRELGKSSLVSDGPAPDIWLDPARPGFASTRVWVTDSTPAKIVFETLQLPHRMLPPANGSVMRYMTLPPDESWKGRVGESEVRAYVAAMGAPGASRFGEGAHPYLQQTRTLDFCAVIEGEVTLVLDNEEVDLRAGQIVVQRGTRHAWSNRSNKPVIVAIAAHDGR